MRARDKPFESKRNMKFFYHIALTKCGDGPQVKPFYRDENQLGNPVLFPKITQPQMLKFLAYLGDIYDPKDFVVEIKGARIMHLWVTDDKWEMYSSLSGEFPHQLRGILAKVENTLPSE